MSKSRSTASKLIGERVAINKNKNNIREIAINVYYGGFSISPQAALWLYKNGMTELAIPAEKFFGDTKRLKTALARWRNRKQQKWASTGYIFSPDEKYVLDLTPKQRDHPLLIECIKSLGKKSFGEFAQLSVVEIPIDVEWEIDEYDGWEIIREKHRTWTK